MEKFIPYEKLSKKEKRKMDLAKRQTWGELNPVTRKPENSKAYNRRKAQNWKKELPTSVPSFFVLKLMLEAGDEPAPIVIKKLSIETTIRPNRLPQPLVHPKLSVSAMGHRPSRSGQISGEKINAFNIVNFPSG